MQTKQLADWLLYFYIYCFLGWIWESCYVSVKTRKLVNRGFMKGPLLPIYGSGAICVLVVTIPVRGNYLLMALVGMAAATVLEYITGAVMEAIFKVRYWDYSTEFLNLNGYVCLKSTLCWGGMTLLMVYGIHQPIAGLVERLRMNTIYILDFAITALAAADFATSFKAAIDFRDVLIKAEKMKEEMKGIQARLDELEKQLAENIAEGSARTKEELLEFGSRKKEAIWELGGRTKEALLEGTARTKDVLLEGTAKTKDVLLEGTAKTKDVLLEGTAKTKDVLLEGTAKTKDLLLGGTARTKDVLLEGASRTKDTLLGGSLRRKEEMQEERRELMLRKRLHMDRQLDREYSKSIRGLLNRNPGTVSKLHPEALEEVKKSIGEHREHKRDGQH